MELTVRRHHLIEESKAELDLAYEEVKRAEQKIMALEREYNLRINGVDSSNGIDYQVAISGIMKEKESIQAKIGIEDLYKMQGMAIEKFAMMSSAFAIVSSVEEIAMGSDLLRELLFKNGEQRKYRIDIDKSVRAFSKGLRAYNREEASHENDILVRRSWARIEELLQQSGGAGCLLQLAHNWADFPQTLRSYELISRYVMPRFQGLNRGREASMAWATDNRDEFMSAGREAKAKAARDYEAEKAARGEAEGAASGGTNEAASGGTNEAASGHAEKAAGD